MDKVNVLIAHYFGSPADAAVIAAVDSRIEVVYAPYVDEGAREFMRSYQAGDVMAVEEDTGEFGRRVGEAEVIFGTGLPENILDLAPNLKWVQAYAAGVDDLAGIGLMEHDVALTSSSGINGPPIAESCLMFMLMNEKNMVKRVEAQARREWTRLPNGQLAGKTVGIVGPGGIGGSVAKLAAACDMRVLAARRTYVPGPAVPNVDEVFPSHRLNDMLAECDYVVAAVSLTDETRGMIGKEQFDAMKPGTFFINVSRGAIVDEAALLDALRSGWLGGAALDVFTQEPLPANSQFWGLPNVIVTPHNTGSLPDYGDRATQFFCENLRRYLDGHPLEGQIDPVKGY